MREKMQHSKTRWQKERSQQMGKGGFEREAKSKMLKQYRTRPAQESWGNGKALHTLHSLEGSREVMDTARPSSPRRLNLCRYNQRVPGMPATSKS